MKNLLLLPLLIGFVTLAGFTDHLEKSLPPYYVSESKFDSSLQKNESMFMFSFSDQAGKVISDSIKYSYNGIEKTIVPDKNGKSSLKVKPGKYRFQFFYNQNFYEIYTDSISIKPKFKTEIVIHFHDALQMIEEDKPVIYVYPTHTESIHINLELNGTLGFTYPQYDNGWNFIADPDGTIHIKDKKYDYLFWEGSTQIDNDDINWEEGFVVKKDSLVPFFETKLSAMGMNSKEIDDYITYWVPKMNINEKNYIHFIFNKDYDQYAKLNVSPKPDQIFQVFMLWSKAATDMETTPQIIPTFKREGFTVVEWGGGEINELPL